MSKFDYINITPAQKSKIVHRGECTPYYDSFWSDECGAICLSGATLPIFTAPMACVVNDKNYMDFDNLGIIPIIPRNISFEKRLSLMKEMVWVAVGLDEFERIINMYDSFSEETYICVDLANGHMNKLLDLCKSAKEKFGDNLILMTGNIANPATYFDYANAKIDYVRLSIGTGSGCATNDLTGIGYKPDKLIQECYEIKQSLIELGHSKLPYIIYDGGCDSVRDIIIALALGADYVMCGKIFAKAEEAAGEIVNKLVSEIKDEVYPDYIKSVEISYLKSGRMYYGMSTQRAQKEIGSKKLKHSEGKEYWVPIEYTLKEWVSQFNAAISSAMSYCNALWLNDFIGKVKINYNTSI